MEGRIDRYASNREDSLRRSGTIPQIDTGRESASAEKEMEGRVDRYASSRDSHSRDGEHSTKSLPSNYDWRKRDRSAITHATSRSPSFFPASASSQDTGGRFQGAFDMSGSKLSPQVPPYTGVSSLALEIGQDDTSHLSPPKRPRLGWGQGLAKYEKKKVWDGDDASKSGTTSGEAPSKAEPQSDEESPLHRVSVSGRWVTAPTSARALLPEISIGDNLPISTEGVAPKVEPGLVHDVRRGSSLEGGLTTVPELTVTPLDGSTSKSTVHSGISGTPKLSPSRFSDHVEALQLSRYSHLTKEADEDGQTMILNDENSKPAPNSGLIDDLSTWTKEAILLRVEKVEGEIDSVEKELAKVAQETEGCLPKKVESNSVDHGGNGHEAASPTTENATQNHNIVEDPTSACSAPSLPSPSMVDSVLVDSTNEGVAEQVAQLSPCAKSPLSSETEQVHNEDLPPLKSLSACSGETDDDGEADALEEITNDLGTEEKRQLVGKDLQLRPITEVEWTSGCESRRMIAYQYSLVYSLIQENRKLAKQAAAPLSDLLPEDASYDRSKFYGSPEDAPVWRENVESHLKNQEWMQSRLAERRKLLRFKERVLALKFRALKEECRSGQGGICQRRDRVKAVRRWEVDRRNAAAFALSSQRPTLRLRPVLSGSVRIDASHDEGHMKKKIMLVTPANHLRQDLKMPSMIIDERERCFRRFVNRNGLVEDPVAYEQERKAMNPWTQEEKKVFLEKFTIFNKNFSKIASFLEHKTTADCVQYYYRNQKAEDFERVRRRHQLKKRRDYSVSGASYLATTATGNNRSHRDVNVTRVQALTLAAYAASRDCTKALRGSSHKNVDKGRSAICDAGSLEYMMGKPGCTRENRGGSSPDLALIGISPVSASAGTPSASKNFRDKLFSKSGPGVVSPSAKGIGPEQHSGSRGMRTTLIHRDPYKIDGEEFDSQWTDTERQLFTDAVAKFGKEFKSISDHVRSKTQTQCKTYFSKTRKRFKLDELVEQSQESPHLVLGLGGVAMKTQSIRNEKVENLADRSYPFSVENTSGEGQEIRFPVDQVKLDMAEINVADGLMLLGKALEAEVALPSKFSDLPAVVSPVLSTGSLVVPSTALAVSSRTTANVSPVSSKVSSVPSGICDLLPKVSSALPMVPDLPPQVADLPSQASDLPASVLNLPSSVHDGMMSTEISDVPSVASDIPAKISDAPSRVSDLLSKVPQSPSTVPDLPLNGSNIPSKDSDLPMNFSELPSTKPGDAATLTIAAEHETLNIEGLPEKSAGSVIFEQQEHPEQTVKSEQIDEDPSVTDDLTKKIHNGTAELSSLKHEPETLETAAMEIRGESERNSSVQPARSTEEPFGVFVVANPQDNNFSSVVVKAEPMLPLDTGGACLTGILPPPVQAVPLAVETPPIIHSGQPRERGSRINATGEFKPRREPTSWTQEEKDKFAEIIRRHGKDWALLDESLPAKSLTQIKTYFQNSKAKLGFLPSDGLTNMSARGGSTRKRKAEESDTSSNAGSTGQTPNPKVSLSLSSEDISQKVMSSSMMPISTNIGAPAVGGDGIGYPHFNQGLQSGEDSSSVRDIQKIIRRMVAANEYPSQSPIPGGLMPLFLPGAFPSPNQQPPMVGAQKPQAILGQQPQQQSLPSPAILQQQQLSQMTPSQRQLLTKVIQQLHQQQLQQQQQQNPHAAHQPQQLTHQLQQQVTQMVAVKQQQQQQQQKSAQVKHVQPQLLQHHVQQAIPLVPGAHHQHQLGSRPKQTVSQQQAQIIHSNRVLHQSSQQQQPFLQQQQFFHQHKQHLLQKLQQEQLSQQIQYQLQQTQKPIHQPQLQHLQQLQQLQQLHQFQLQKEHAQQQVQQQQIQQKQLQQQAQQQAQQSLGLFRSPFQSSFTDSDLLRQSEIIEERSTTSKLGLLPREDVQQVQTQRPAQILPQQPVRAISSSEPQQLRLGDVKLFGQSLLSQPPPTIGQASISSSHKLWQPVVTAPTGPAAMPASNLSKVYGKDPLLAPSAFARAAASIPSDEGHAQSWSAASTGNLDMWNSMMGGLQGVVLYKNEDAKSEFCSVQDAVARMTARLSQKAHEKDGDDIVIQNSLEHVELGGTQDLKTKEVVGDIVRTKDGVEIPSECGREHAQVEVEWQHDSLLQPMSTDQRNAQVGVSTSGQGGVNDDLLQQILALRRESGNEAMSGSGSLQPSASALKRLLSGSGMSQLLHDSVYAAQPNAGQANLLSNMSINSWATRLGPHSTDSQVVSAGPSFQSGALLRNYTGQEEQSLPAESKNIESSPGGSG